jgi:MFS family permease
VTGLPARLGPLGHRSFRIYWTGQAVSSLGNGMQPVALAFAVLSLHGSATELGLVLALSVVAQVVFLLMGGVWADRLPRQRVMLVADLVRASTQLAVAALLLTGGARIWHLAVAGVVSSLAASVFRPASSGLVPETVDGDRLQQANSLVSMSESAGYLAGPAVAGILVAVTSPGWAYAIDGSTFLVSAVSLALLPLAPRPARPRQGVLRDLAEGWHEVAGRRWYWLNLCSHGLWNLAIAFFFVLGPVVAQRRLGGASAWGLVASGLSAGSILGGLVALRVRPTRPLVRANLALTLTVPLFLGLAVPLPAPWLAALAVLGFCGLAFANAVWAAVVQERVPREALSRVSAYDWVISLVVMPVGYALAGPLAARLGTATTLVGASLFVLLPSLAVALTPAIRVVRYVEPATAGVMEAPLVGE